MSAGPRRSRQAFRTPNHQRGHPALGGRVRLVAVLIWLCLIDRLFIPQDVQQCPVIRNAFQLEPDSSVLADQIGNPPAVELLLQLSAGIGHQREAKAMLPGEFSMRFEIIGTDAHDLGVELFKTGNIPLKSQQFVGSDRGKIGKVKGQDDGSLCQKV